MAAEILERREMLTATVTRTSLNLRFSTDPTSSQPQQGEYQSFAVKNTNPTGGETYNDVWFRATNFVQGQKVQLGSGEDGLYHLGSLAPGETKIAYIYMVAATFTTPGNYEYQHYTAEAWDGKPNLGTSTRIAFEPEQFEWVGQAIVDDSSARTDSVSVTYFFGATQTPVPYVGGTMKMTVAGEVKQKPDRILFTPATTLDWPADKFELASAVVTYSNPPPLLPDEIFEKPIPPASTPKDFSVEYTFNIEGTTSTPTPVTPSQATANGTETLLKRKFENSRLLDGVADIPVPQYATGLEITKTGTAFAVAGSTPIPPYSHTITVAATGLFDSQGVVVTDVWPAGFTKQTINPPSGTTIEYETTGFRWIIGTLAVGTSLSLKVNFTVPITTATGGYTDFATVSSTTPNPNPVTASATTTVVNVPLQIAKVGDSATVQAGSIGHSYVITVTNPSSQYAAENVTVVDTWPVEFTQGGFSVSTGQVFPLGGGDFRWEIGPLAALATATLTVGFSVPLATPLKLYTNTAVVTSNTYPAPQTTFATTLVEPATTPGLIVSSDDGCNPAFVQFMTATGVPVGPVLKPYGNVCGGVRAAAGDINGDGVDELVVAPGRGIAGPVKVYALGGTVPLFSFYPYGAAWRGGVELACADVNNNGRKEIITGMSLGIGTVNVYTVSGIVPSLYRTFRGAPAGYAGGVRIAAADFGTYKNGKLDNTALDGKAEVIVGPNAGTLARVGIYDLSTLTPTLARTIIPFGPGYTGGVTLSTGNYDGDAAQIPDIFVGAGIGRQSVVSVFNAQTGAQIGIPLTYFSTFTRPNAAVNVQPLDVAGTGKVDNLYGVQGLNGGGGTRGVLRVQLGTTPTVSTLQNYLPPLRIKAVNLQGYPGLASLRVVRPR